MSSRDILGLNYKGISQLLNKIPSSVVGVRFSTVQRYLTEEPGKMKVLLVSSKPQTPLMWKVLSFKHSSTITFGIASQSDSDIVKQYGISQFPTLLVWTSPFAEPKAFKGEMTFKKISDVLVSSVKDFQKESSRPDALKLTKSNHNTLCPQDALCAILFVNDDDKVQIFTFHLSIFN
jgi:hypothetical protein